MQFLDVKTDFAFKKVFGSQQSKPVLIDFLNAMLDYSGDYAIADLEIVDPYQIPLIKGMKDSFVDVKARLANGSRVIIEMQVLNVEGFEQRILFNAAKQYSSQLQKSEHYRLLNPVIALTFTDFILFKDDATQVLSRFKLMEKQRLVEYGDDNELVFVELPKFTLTLEQLTNIQQQWIYFVKNAGKLNFIPESLNTPSLRQAFDIINEASLSAEELEAQHKRHDFIILQRDSLTKARSDGREQGREEGREEGQQIARNTMIRQAQLSGFSQQQIASLLNITQAELTLQLQRLGL